jgi:hypothetical protein
MTKRKRKFWPWAVAVLMSLPLLQLLSFGPVCWLAARGKLDTRLIEHGYQPILWTIAVGPSPIAMVARRYAEIGKQQNGIVILHCQPPFQSSRYSFAL